MLFILAFYKAICEHFTILNIHIYIYTHVKYYLDFFFFLTEAEVIC